MAEEKWQKSFIQNHPHFTVARNLKAAIHVVIWLHAMLSCCMKKKVVLFFTTHPMQRTTVRFCNANVEIYRLYATNLYRVYLTSRRL